MKEEIKHKYDKNVENFLEFYSQNHQLFEEAAKTYQYLIAEFLKDKNLKEFPKITYRIKTKEECTKKFVLKYRDSIEEEKL
ncbi:MAG: hypothetical protein IPK03_03315 [Bacteroidetes bacterium]|nr:hypothetical protein [Bacteroidota bacterium]